MNLYLIASVLNYLINLLLLYISSCYVSVKISWQRIAVMSAVQSVLNLIAGKLFPINAYGGFVTLMIAVLCGHFAYFRKENCLRGLIIYGLLQTIVSLISLSVEKDELRTLVIVFACVFGIRRLSASSSSKDVLVDVEICHNDKSIKLKALRDTGNFLVDPLTGQSVVLIGLDAAKSLTGLSEAQISDPVSTIVGNVFPGLRLLPFRTIGKSNGILLAYKFVNVKIGDIRGSRLVAFVSEGLTGEEGYQALTGGKV